MTKKRVSTSRGVKWIEEPVKAPTPKKKSPKKKREATKDVEVQSSEEGERTREEDK